MDEKKPFPEKGWRALWRAVLDQAFKDAQGHVGTYAHRRDAREWFCSNRNDLGSFLWICEVLDLDPEVTLARVDDGENMAPFHMRDFGYQGPALMAAL